MKGAGTTDSGERLWAQAPRLRLLLRHLVGGALRERVELDDLVQETFLRVLAWPGGLPLELPAMARTTRSSAAAGADGQFLEEAGAAADGSRDTNDAALWRLLVHVARHVVVDVARAARAAKRGGGRDGVRDTAQDGQRDGYRDARITAPGSRGPRLSREDWSRAGPGVSQLSAATAGPATRAAGRETAASLERAFARLSSEHRRVLGLRQLQGLSAEAAGKRMGRSAAAVHSLYRRALLAWEQALREVGAQSVRSHASTGF